VVLQTVLGNSPDEGTRQAAKYALQAGTILVAAAGNAGYNGRNTIGYPAKFFEFLCIGATQSNGSIANFSSGGREIDIATPGQNIISASTRGGYIGMSGTSMATPFAAGLCALVIELMRREGHASMTGVEAWRTFLSQWSEDRGNPGKDVRYGYGVPRYTDIVESLVGDEIKWT
jgi:subtilisin family serine protease